MSRFSRFGTLPESPADDRDYEIKTFLVRPTSMASTLPDVVGTVNADIHRTYVPVSDQGEEGSCTGHAMRNTKAVNERRPRTASDRARVPDFGARGIYHLAKQVGGYPDEEGAYMRDVVKAAQQFGVPREKDWPYAAVPPGPSGSPIPRWLQYARPWGIGSYARVNTLEEMLVTLHDMGPLFIAMNLTESFMDTGSDGVVPKPSGAALGGHAMCLLSAHQSSRRFFGVNSWGTGWGQNGYFWLDFDTFLGGPREAWAIPDKIS